VWECLEHLILSKRQTTPVNKHVTKKFQYSARMDVQVTNVRQLSSLARPLVSPSTNLGVRAVGSIITLDLAVDAVVGDHLRIDQLPVVVDQGDRSASLDEGVPIENHVLQQARPSQVRAKILQEGKKRKERCALAFMFLRTVPRPPIAGTCFWSSVYSVKQQTHTTSPE